MLHFTSRWRLGANSRCEFALILVLLSYRPPFPKASDASSGSLVATAASKANSHSVIKVWRCTKSRNDAQSDAEKTGSLSTSLTVRQLALIIVLCCLMQALTSQLPLNTLSAIVSERRPTLQAESPLRSSGVPANTEGPGQGEERKQGKEGEQGKEREITSNSITTVGLSSESSVLTLDLDLWVGGLCQ
jgi:hypothetical protein